MGRAKLDQARIVFWHRRLQKDARSVVGRNFRLKCQWRGVSLKCDATCDIGLEKIGSIKHQKILHAHIHADGSYAVDT